MLNLQNITIKSFLFLGFISFLFFGVFGLSHFSMDMGMDGKMFVADCPFMVGGTLCTMTLFEHVSAWQDFFASTPFQDATLILVYITSVFVLVYWIKELYSPPKNNLLSFKYTQYTKYLSSTNSLQELFSNGILNPKLF